jgi:AcrR family transcriptional regulator
MNPRKLPRQERSRVTVEAILQATAHILTEKGYDHTNTNLIAELAGVSIGSLYQYFPNKESLMVALMEQHSHEIAELVESKLNHLFDDPPEIAIPELVKAVLAVHGINPRLHQVLSEEIPRSQRLKMQQTDDRIATLLQEYLKRWRDSLKPQNIEMTVPEVQTSVQGNANEAAAIGNYNVVGQDATQNSTQGQVDINQYLPY